MTTHRTTRVLAFAIGSASISALAWAAPPLSGAIFTTVEDGSVVNENVHYDAKEDVYLDGGPGPNAPASAAGLPEGDYYFQVTDPSGKDLLSSDHISCRRIHVNEYGVIDEYYTDGTNYVRVESAGKGKKSYSWAPTACTDHATGTDIDHGGSPENAITVQLYPYDDTPNNGGVYKVWIIPTTDYEENVGSIIDPPTDCGSDPDCAVNGEDWHGGYFHGFIGSDSKTDNFKVKKKGKPCDAPTVMVRKFEDDNENGAWDSGEAELTWKVFTTDTLAMENTEYTPFVVTTPLAGDYVYREDSAPGWEQTALIVDGVSKTVSDSVTLAVAGTCGETHTIDFGNVMPDVSTCPVGPDPLGTATAYNVVVFGDYTAWNSDVGGKTAVGGNASFSSMGLGSALTAPAGDVVSVAGTLAASNGQTYAGDTRAAGTCSFSSWGHPSGILSCSDSSTFDAGDLEGELQDLADYLTTLPVTGSVSATSWGAVTLTGTDSDQNVFDLDLDAIESQFSSGVTLISGFTIDVPVGSTAIVNVRGNTGIFMQNGSFTLVGVDSSHTLYNFDTASSLVIKNVGVKGSVLAPWAAVSFNNGHIDGTLIAASLSGTGESHEYLFDGTICLTE
jgi:choice-of-anchor A domain-containing protein